MIKFGLTVGAFLFASASTAQAATIIFNPVVDLSSATTYSNGYLSVSLGGDPIELHAGDEITGHLSFANGGRLMVADNHNLGLNFEQIFVQIYDPIEGGYGQGSAVSYYTSTLTGVLGDFVGGTDVPGSYNGTLGIARSENLTDSSFSFDGIDYSIDFHEGTSTQFVPGSLHGGIFGILSVATPAVPEPSTWLMMLLGFGAIGISLRRNWAKATRLSLTSR